MPLRYSGTRYTTSVRRKHFLLTAVAGLLQYNRWDEIPSKVLEAAEREGALGMDRAVQQDNHTKRQGQIRDDEMAPRFRLPSPCGRACDDAAPDGGQTPLRFFVQTVPREVTRVLMGATGAPCSSNRAACAERRMERASAV